MDINYLLQDFISNNKYICELAIAEGWIGNYYQTQISEGLLGYMVFSYQKQDAILNNKEEALKFPFRYNPDDMKELKDFFCLNFFRDDVIRNGKITHFITHDNDNNNDIERESIDSDDVPPPLQPVDKNEMIEELTELYNLGIKALNQRREDDERELIRLNKEDEDLADNFMKMMNYVQMNAGKVLVGMNEKIQKMKKTEDKNELDQLYDSIMNDKGMIDKIFSLEELPADLTKLPPENSTGVPPEVPSEVPPEVPPVVPPEVPPVVPQIGRAHV